MPHEALPVAEQVVSLEVVGQLVKRQWQLLDPDVSRAVLPPQTRPILEHSLKFLMVQPWNDAPNDVL